MLNEGGYVLTWLSKIWTKSICRSLKNIWLKNQYATTLYGWYRLVNFAINRLYLLNRKYTFRNAETLQKYIFETWVWVHFEYGLFLIPHLSKAPRNKNRDKAYLGLKGVLLRKLSSGAEFLTVGVHLPLPSEPKFKTVSIWKHTALPYFEFGIQ